MIKLQIRIIYMEIVFVIISEWIFYYHIEDGVTKT